MLNLAYRRVALGAALALLAAPAAFAQTAPAATAASAGQQPGGRMGRGAEMMKELNLSADQQTKIEAIMRESRPAERPSGPPTDAERQAMQARRAEMDVKIKAVLTPEQYTKYQAMRPQRGQRPQSN